MTTFSEDFLKEDEFEAVLVTFCCYNYGANASEVVRKIARDQKANQTSYLWFIVCSIPKACYQ